MPGMIRRSAPVLLCLLMLVPASLAVAAGYGKGTFTGKVVGSKSGSSADVKLKVKGKKISVEALLHLNDCAGENTGITDVTVTIPPRKIRSGPAGGGFATQRTVTVPTAQGPLEVDLSLAGGVRTKSIRSTFDAYAASPLGSDAEVRLDCSLSGDLKAKK